MKTVIGRDAYDWIAIAIVGVGALLVASIAHAEPSEVVLQTIAMESASEPEGMPYVALTLINRARNRGTSPEIEALRPFQYSAWNGDGKWAKAWLRSYWGVKTSLGARNALKQGVWLASQPRFQGIRHYHTKAVHPAWAIGHKPVLEIGSHLFYEGIR